METVPAPERRPDSSPIAPVVATAPVGRRRRPSGEPPPLPRHIDPSTRRFLLIGVLTVVLWMGLLIRPTAAWITWADLTALRGLAHVRTHPLTRVMEDVNVAATGSAVRIVAWSTIAGLALLRRGHRLGVYLAVLLVASLLGSTMALEIGRMRPAELVILGHWDGYANPSRPVMVLALVLVGGLYTLLPRGLWRNRAGWCAAAFLGVVCFCRLYLAVDHPTDIFAAIALGWAIPVVVYRLVLPDDAFPVSYRPGQHAHLDVAGRRGEAIVQALDHQLGLQVDAVEPFGGEGSAGSTPLRVRARRPGEDTPVALFGKLYALSHLRSDRWYKLVRTVRFGRLEDEKPFSSVRRLVEYEDHLLRLFRDAGLPTPAPYGIVEITPEREYLIVMELFDGATEVGTAPVDDQVIDEGLVIVRRMWDAGVAHRDIKPSNLLTRGGRVFLIDVAFGTVRPSPWRQAVDLANMMLTLALSSSPEHVYHHALQHFAPEDIAEAFAASRSITIPTQLRNRLRLDERDLLARFRELAPDRPPVAIQLWSFRRVALTLAVLGGAALAGALLVTYVNVAGLR